MTDKDKMELAMICFDGDKVKALALLRLLDTDPYECHMPDVIMEVPKEND